MDQKTPANENAAKIAKEIKGIRFAMLTTVALDGSLHSRPMAAQEQDFDGDLWFFTGKDSVKVDELERNNQVNVAFSSPDDNRYVSISGTARLVTDRAKIEELYTPAVKAWFPEGKDDPNIALLHVDPALAEYWDSPNSKLVQVAGFLKAIATGERAKGGENETVKL
ncbi:MAG TPA: pyridoxamine 5'-phosphate oxidase family protein [Herpetosiphonaceae bacterium]|nr:pyridoxamine 5'-phosphate oxidase family protein [Herpetosiphonaceae bacterium]